MARKFVRVEQPTGPEFPRAAPLPALATVQRNDELAEVMASIQPAAMRTEPVDDFNATTPDEYEPWQGAKGFTANLDDPLRLAKEESLGANLIKWMTGKTDEAIQIERSRYTLDPNVEAINNELTALEQAGKVESHEYSLLMEELETTEEELNQRTAKPEFSASAVAEAFKKDPGAFAAEFTNAIATDPELLLTPIGWELAAARAGLAASRLGIAAKATTAIKTGAGATGAAAVGGATTGAIAAGEQLAQSGEITDPDQVALDAALGAGAAVVLTGAFKGIQRAVTGGKPKVETEPLDQIAHPQVQPDELSKALDDFDFKKQSEYGAAFENMEQISRLQRVVDEDAANAILDAANKPFRDRFGGVLQPGETTIAKAMREASTARSQAGRVDPAVLAATSMIGIGAAAGAAFAEDPLTGAVAGAAAGVGAILAGRTLAVLGRGSMNAFKFVSAPDNRIKISKLVDQHEADVAVNARSTWQVKMKLMDQVKDTKEREAISHFLEGTESVKLSKEGMDAAKTVRGLFNTINEVAQKEGVMDTFLENYVPHFWRQKGQSKSEIVNALTENITMGGMGSKTPHAKKRVIPTLARGQELGMTPQTLDIAEIYKMYADGVYRAIRNKQLASALREEIAPDGKPMIISDKAAPGDYVPVSHPQFMGERVHPDIAPSLNFVYNSSDPNVITRGVLALNFAMKRSLVSMSFFHANALVESMIYAGVNPLRGKNLPSALEMLRHGGAGDMVDEALRSGLKIGAIEDVGSDSFYAAIKDVEKIANDILPIAGGATVRGYEWLNKKVDVIMWDKIATGGKLSVFATEMEKALLKNATQHAKNPEKFPIIPREELASDVSEYVNDAFGGLNWRRIAEGTKTKLGRDIALAAFSPGGRKAMQLAMFAPDWTIANIRVLLKAIPGQSRNKRIARMHQYYAARGATFYATLGSAINMMYTGRPIWENVDPSTVDMGDGRRMTFSKQFVEPYHWLVKPGSTAINKMGILPKTAIELAKGVKYFSGKPSDPPLYSEDDDWLTKRAAEAGLVAKKFTPIFAQQTAEQGVSGMAGFVGHPIYGKPLE